MNMSKGVAAMAASDNVPDTVNLYNANDSMAGRNGGPYLDQEMAKLAEEQNAAREGRKPNLSPANLAKVTHPGIALVTGAQLARINATAGDSPIGDITAKPVGVTANPAKIAQKRLAEKARIAQVRAENAAADADDVFGDATGEND